MSLTMNYLFMICCLASIYSCNGCQMEGVTIWQLPINVRIEDYHDGIILQRGITDIIDYSVTSYADLNGGPYVDVSITDSLFVLRTNAAYREYEENETSLDMSLTFTFTCADGTTSLPLTVRIDINDNNNNDPLFKAEDMAASADTTYDFTIAPPVPPGFLITDCVRDIIVRDIDLTTYRIDFGIEENPYIEIEYDESSSTVAKEFKAVLKTTTFIRSLPEPIVLRISATDVDLTGDDPITTYTTVTIHGSAEFELPTEPVFSEPFYLANYQENGQVTLEQTIFLQQGYDDQVVFSLEGDYAEDHFNIHVNGNQVVLVLTSPLPAEVFRRGQIFLVVRATRAYTSGASATIVVQLPEAVNLEFQQPNYEGEIVDNTLQLTQLIFSQGYQESTVTVTIEDYPSYFTASVVGNVITLSMVPLEANIIEQNNFISLRVTASTDYSSATTIVTLEIIKDDTVTPVFEKPLYDGTYDTTLGLTLEPLILIQGYDDTVQVTFSGEYESYFELVRDGASSTLSAIGALPPQVLSNTHLLISVEAAKPRTVGASAVVSITLPAARELQFEAPTYRGSIQDNILNIETIILNVGYNEDVTFSLSGDYSSSFIVTNVQNEVSINIATQLPPEVLAQNNVLLWTITAVGQNSLSTSATVLVDIIKDDITTPVFGQPIYFGNYLESSGIDIANINLVQGYDNSVVFGIEGENSQYFQINQNVENSLTLSVQSSIPEEVILREKVFVFNIFADKPLTVGANAAISIKFSAELTEPTVMQFAKNTYTGSLEENILTLENIVLETGFAAGTEFHLTGDYASYFTTAITNNLITLSLPGGLSADILDNNKFLVLELEARREMALSVFTSIVIDLVEAAVVTPVFNQAYYTGKYTGDNVLQFEETMTLLQGYDETVTFGLEGESSVWFTVVQNGNSASLIASSDVPQDVLDNKHQLLFTVVADKPNAISGRSAISIDLPKDILTPEVLLFEQNSYQGQIDGSNLQIPTITLMNESTDLAVELTGDHAAYFSVSLNLNTVHVSLLNDLPPELLSNNEFLVIGITASKPDAVSGYTTLILTIVKEPQIVTPIFEQTFYIGEFSDQDGLLFVHTIRLMEGFDDSVLFTLDGDNAQWFTLVAEGNSVTLVLSSAIPPAVVANNQQLVFVVTALKPNSNAATATVVISLVDDFTDATVLGFERASYLGTIENDISTIEPIVLNEGFTTTVMFTLHGDLASYFTLTVQGSSVSVVLQHAIPEQSVPTSNIVLLELRAIAPQAVPAVTAVVFEVVREEVVTTEELTFGAPYYTGQFSVAGGLLFETAISLIEGYDQNVQFALEGDHAQWFTLVAEGNSVTLVLSSVIPPAVIANNQQLVFVVSALKPNSNTAKATVVISLIDDFTDATVLGFERASYLGTIVNDVSTIEPIVLNEGFTSTVMFTLHGDLASYFTLAVQGSSVSVVLQTAIPEQSVPTSNIVLLELRAAAPQAVPAVTAVVFEVVREEIVITEELTFGAPYYTGQFSVAGGLLFETAISIIEGYDQNVQFALEGDHAQWFTLVAEGNSVTLVLSSVIPPAVIANNQQLVFVVSALKPNSNTAKATVVISLIDDFTDATVLGFERASYLGTIVNDVSTIEPIVLNEGFTSTVMFTLHGDLASYFTLAVQGSSVSVVLQTAIPEQSVPTSNIVLLELRAAAPQAVPAVTAVVFEVVREEVVTTEELTFGAPYYTGQFSVAGGLLFETAISLIEGYDQNVQFALEGDHAQWFTLVAEGNSVTLVLSSVIPPAVIANNQQLVFVVSALKPNSNTAKATVVISLIDDFTDATVLGFERASYLGTIVNDVSTIEPIVLNEGFTSTVMFTLHGDLASYFTLAVQGSSVSVVLQTAIPEQYVSTSNIVLLELRAAAPQAVPAVTAVVFEVVREEIVITEELTFGAPYYTGQFSVAGGLLFETAISLIEGYDQNVQFSLEGDHAQWFTLVAEGNSVTLVLSSVIPPAVIANNQQLVFVVSALKPNSNTAKATVVISLIDDFTDATVLGFERASYLGTIVNDVSTIEPIVLNEGFTSTVMFTLHGDLASYFTLAVQGSSVSVVLQTAIPEQYVSTSNIVLLELRAAAPQAVPAVTAVVFEVVREEIVITEELTFGAPYYTGQFSVAGGLLFETAISLIEGYDQNVQFSLEGDHAQWFTLVAEGNSVTLVLSSVIPPAVIANNQQLVFVVSALKPNSNTAKATVVISLIDDFTDATVLGFERASYLGTIVNDVSTIEPIVLNEGFTSTVMFTLHGDLASYFTLAVQGSSVSVVLQTAIPEQSVSTSNIVLLELRAAAPQEVPAVTAVVFEVVREEVVTTEELTFGAPYYTGQFSVAGGLLFETAISLIEGYDQNVQFALEGDHAQWFTLVAEGNSVTLVLSIVIPPAVIANNQQLVFVVTALKPNSNTAKATVVISLVDGSSSVTDVAFDKVIYEGIISVELVQHELISITGYDGDAVEIFGDYRDLFSASASEGTVTVVAAGSVSLPQDVAYLPLELRAGGASAVLLLHVTQSETPELPSVTFGAPSYVLRVDMAHTGLVGRVSATASNGETVTYTLSVHNVHLQERVSVNGDGEIHLSAPTNTGVYSFQVIAASIITQVQATATVHLTVDATSTCGEDGHVLPPLIILERDEEDPHENLVVLDSATNPGCQFRLTNRWPLEHDWLYVNENGLHARSIDREDPRIAFMALSQVQVELVLECPSDSQTRAKRSVNTSSRLDWLGPYEYGSNKWILTDTILYNSRRSFVNLIVNDINDNNPIFIGKENEPIVVGYPIRELEEIVLPRALAELKATDADVGENAALRYWSAEESLAVAPTTGSVHVRDGSALADGALLVAAATDRNGQDGLTGTIQLLVKLLDVRHIAVVTIRNAFLDQEEDILRNISAAVGYEVKVLSSAVISDDTDADSDYSNTRNKREVTSAEGASLQLYVYGVIDREPVAVYQLSTDITENVLTGVDIARTISLEDHLEGREIPSGRDTALLVSTIVLSVLLFILIAIIAVWFFLRWRKTRNYEQFSDGNSVASRNEPLEPPPKVDSLKKPRLNLEELKKSERRLQEMLDAPIKEVPAKPSTSAVDPEGTFDTIINMAPPDTPMPIVIQSIDRLKDDADSGDEDEFGEKTNKNRRKSVVTFNENVEKIIHVEDIPDDNSDVEVFRL